MARQARIVLPDTPHHIMQRGNRSEPVFFDRGDFETYIDILSTQCKERNVQIWAYCLLPNQVHLIARPSTSVKFFAQSIGEAHRRYTHYINDKKGWRGHLFQDRFSSYAMDDKALLEAGHFIENLPVISGITPKPEQYLWSSAKAHIKDRDDALLASEQPLKFFMPDWQSFIEMPPSPMMMDNIRMHLQTGRPRGGETFLSAIEAQLGKRVRALSVGRPRKAA